ncbi:hypothetical protein LIER_14644 [Lithospermum erythrorhizon]|uniref:Uncharacterized protein n=1 Tax=Lithospermum erythrorhizon TaxID=34254 RepID=A0AAV3Q0W2_LITER
MVLIRDGERLPIRVGEGGWRIWGVTKCDLASLRAVPTEDAQEFAERENLCFMETSSLKEIYMIISKKTLKGHHRLLRGSRLLFLEIRVEKKRVDAASDGA